MPGSSFDILPEELTEQILSLCVTAPLESPPPRPMWLPPPTSPSQSVPTGHRRRSSAVRTRLAPLLVSKKFNRISTPHYYSTVHITSPEQAAAFLRTLEVQLHPVGLYVRRFVSSSVIPTLGAVLQHCNDIRDIDICLDSGPAPSSGVDSVTEEFCNALDGLEGVRHISLRKASNAYLTLPRIRYILTRLAVTVEKWTYLESATVAFRMSDDNPQTLLALAYPSILQGHPPSVPTAAPLTVSLPGTHSPLASNPSLQKIILGDQRTGVMISGLFMNEAKKHTRLAELIKAGTPIVRMRAQTLGNFGNIANTPAAGVAAATSPSTTRCTASSGCGKVESDHVPVPVLSRSNSISSSSSSFSAF
ncbi:hypothetical protein BT96DRAFT_918072 [Gymnopus androsaceus JB14]|uniref:Uncharacterized protein n=1 Tax=Gymnopus androsaceus JB14 TaxID=1447944 RepID=A0A6A4HZC2_9AGAR|nr:hypothetical protein BT96DRAFT_918072 [Gymnopus androsaceus JB14]